MTIRELPPLRLHIDGVTPSGRHYRWGHDERRPENVPGDLRFSDTIPGGFESMDVTLARKPAVDYSDLARLSTLRVLGAGGDVAGEYRLERAPRVSGDHMAVSPSAVGWQAHLDDDKSAMEVYVDQMLSKWEPASSTLRLTYMGSGFQPLDGQLRSDISNPPAIALDFSRPWSASGKPVAEAVYRSPVPLGAVYYAWNKAANVNAADANWSWDVLLTPDDAGTAGDTTGNLRAAGPGSGFINATAERRFARVRHYYNAAAVGTEGETYGVYFTALTVYGDHGLSGYGTLSDSQGLGLLGSDVVTHAVGRWAPLLQVTDESVQPSTFAIPHLAFLEPTTVAEIIRQATRFGLQDWAVWEDKTFYWHERGERGRNWRARIGPFQLEETGPQVDRLWESIIVQYQDVDGSTRTVGPPGSGADTESADLKDDDPENPANQLGIIRRDLLAMGTGTIAGATEIGRRFLEQTKLLDSSGRARIVGHVQDDRGVMHPYWRVRAGDYISFVDAADTSYRRIVKSEKSDADRSCIVELDAPPDGLAALLERLGVVLVPLGL